MESFCKLWKNTFVSLPRFHLTRDQKKSKSIIRTYHIVYRYTLNCKVELLETFRYSGNFSFRQFSHGAFCFLFVYAHTLTVNFQPPRW